MKGSLHAHRRARRTFGAAAWSWLLVLLLPAPGALSQINPTVVPNLQPYLDVIEQYRRGDFEAAVVTLRSWTEAEAARSVGGLMDRRTPGGQIPDVPGMFAAAMLHTDTAFAAIDAQRTSDGSFHLRAAADLLAWTMLKVPDERQWLFARRDWRLMVVRILNFHFAWDVEQSLRQAHRWAPDEVKVLRAKDLTENDADMELALGSLAAGFAYMNARDLSVEGRSKDALVRQCRQRAEGHFRRALALRPDMLEARLRLGRVVMEQERTAEAEAELRTVLERSTDPRTMYLALLFLGEAAEKDHRLQEATALYRRAVDVKPDCQAARVALAYASEREGRLDAARLVLTPLLDRSGTRTIPADDWTSYPSGQFQEGFEALDRLRTSVVRQ
jgi:tetratricopeptide (TPR) repeat protein